MNLKRFLPLAIAFTTSMSVAYFWEDWGKRTTPQERVEKEKIDLEYRQKSADIDYKKKQAAREGYEKSQKKQADLEHKKEKLELKRKQKRLNVEQE
jgi:hypothetical protein